MLIIHRINQISFFDMTEQEGEAFDYTVVDGDTLQSISVRFDVSILQIRQYNNFLNLCPGEVLKIPTKTLDKIRLNPIDSQIFNQKIPIDGALLLIDEYIRFEPYSRSIKPIMLSLKGLVHSTIESHPCEIDSLPDELLQDDALSLINVYYLEDPEHDTNFKTIVFTGKLSELKSYQTVMEQRAKSVQEKTQTFTKSLSFYLPKPAKAKSLRQIPKIAFNQGESTVLEASDSALLRGALPNRFKGYDWHLKYRISRDGSSFTSFSSAIQKVKCAILLIRTNHGDVIGCFASSGIKINSRQYYSTCDSFVFTFTPTFTPYRWARTTQFFINATPEDLSIGGSGSAAIWIDGNFLNGFSEKCNAFNSSPLSTKVEFKVNDMEVWEVGH
ncbi:TLD family protein [Tritrichomonas foetus]|uniref:Oxidation resistance protein 1 n=1 Tax=Tritrichomonas foetus TaxID=1144522 RepID=A0A1J4KIQ6_9EUKA|nr:TLD family protein [Tritrichomonas foetus]|eukprot:OHT11115.1 TLD family protein [Tritrichomonas foetus]